jgi:hypothetical protein
MRLSPSFSHSCLRNVDFNWGVQSLKVQMERLQWGFPIATALSLNKPHQKTKSNSKTNIHASEAKGPFSRREEGWELGEEKETKEREKKVTLRMGKENT